MNDSDRQTLTALRDGLLQIAERLREQAKTLAEKADAVTKAGDLGKQIEDQFKMSEGDK